MFWDLGLHSKCFGACGWSFEILKPNGLKFEISGSRVGGLGFRVLNPEPCTYGLLSWKLRAPKRVYLSLSMLTLLKPRELCS